MHKKQLCLSSYLFLVGMAIVISLGLVLTGWQGVNSQEAELSLPPLQVHSLPLTLAQWQDPQQTEDYFSEVKATSVGYLIWSEVPIKVYLQRPDNPDDASASTRQFLQWVAVVEKALGEWNLYLPLVEVNQPELADITIERSPPPIGVTLNPETGQFEFPRARSAQTRYNFYLKPGTPSHLSHRMMIQIKPGLSNESILSAARHELGHALGIWGHSQIETDALYFSQVRNSPPISSRDINTLKKVYQQPTRLGWALEARN